MHWKKGFVLWALAGWLLVACGQEKENSDARASTQMPDSATAEPVQTLAPAKVPEPTLEPTPEATELPAVSDSTPPILEGVKDITIYCGEPVVYRQGISLSDDSGETPTLQIDTSQVDLKTPGSYPVVYRATDDSGNETMMEITLQILEPPSVEEVEVRALAAQLTEELVTEDMSDYDKVYTLWNWCRKNIRYAYVAGDRSSVWTGAYEGLHDKVGDCYAYYATLEVLLTQAGIENMCVSRVGGDSNHWWNLVKVDGMWYHCDASPRSNGDPYRCFLQTDAQIQAYTEWNDKKKNYYTFAEDNYPSRATEILYGNTPERILATAHTTPQPAVTCEPLMEETMPEAPVPAASQPPVAVN